LAKFRREFIALIEQTNPTNVGPAIPIRPIYRPDVAQPSILRDSALKPVGESPLLRDTVVG
jgi:hypothetical protein